MFEKRKAISVLCAVALFVSITPSFALAEEIKNELFNQQEAATESIATEPLDEKNDSSVTETATEEDAPLTIPVEENTPEESETGDDSAPADENNSEKELDESQPVESVPDESVPVEDAPDETESDDVEYSIVLSQINSTLTVGETYKLEAVVTPDDLQIVWESSDSAIASVDNEGLVTANDVGRVTVSVFASDDKSVYAEIELEIVPAVVETTLAEKLAECGDSGKLVITDDVVVTESITLPETLELVLESGTLTVDKDMELIVLGRMDISGGALVLSENAHLSNGGFISVSNGGSLTASDGAAYNALSEAILLLDCAGDVTGAAITGIDRTEIDYIGLALDGGSLRSVLSSGGYRHLTVRVCDPMLLAQLGEIGLQENQSIELVR